MAETDHRITMEVAATPQRVYEAAASRDGVAGWWTADTTFDGREGSVLRVDFPKAGFFAEMRVTELCPPKRVRWVCEDARHPPGVSSDPHDWRGTEIEFEFEPLGPQEVRLYFVHKGLIPLECSDTCRRIWDFYIRESFKQWVETGKGQPATSDGEEAK